MTNREMLSVIKNVKSLFAHIESVAINIIKDTFDYHIRYIEDILVLNTHVIVSYVYLYNFRDEHKKVRIPIEWFDEGFDYQSAYKEPLAQLLKKGGNEND